MDSFLVKIKSEEELINGIIELNKIGALGSKICFGTYLPDSYTVNDIINNNRSIWCKPKDDDDICAFSIGYDDNQYRNEKFPHLFGKNHILVTLVTMYDVKKGDIPKTTMSYDKMINETLKLMNIKPQ